MLYRRDYRHISQLHFDIGYVPKHQSVDDFAQSLRAIGEPLVGRNASEISMAKVLAQLLDNTALFEMEARTELVMLQKKHGAGGRRCADAGPRTEHLGNF